MRQQRILRSAPTSYGDSGAVVTKDIPASGLAVGNPVRVIRTVGRPVTFGPSVQFWKLTRSDAARSGPMSISRTLPTPGA
jgi:hypothetical protein